MSKFRQNGTTRPTSDSILVLKDKCASEVAKDMIEIGNQEEPFYIFDFDVAYNQVRNFREKMPRIQIFYAMKSNDESMMLKLAIASGLGFDCASPGEINKIRAHDVPPTCIIYAAPMKTPMQMTFARASGVRHTTFDSSCELNRLNRYWPDARLVIRLKLESDSVYKLGDKFGCDFSEALSLLEEAAQLGMIVIGVAFHVGSGCFSKESYTAGLRLARSLFDHEAREGRRMTLLDIGGGFFDDGTDRFDQVAELINSGIGQWFSEPDIQIIAEPGRYLCESAFTHYSNIRSMRTIINSNNTFYMVYLNSGANGTLRFIEQWHAMDKLKRTKDKGGAKVAPQDTIIWGPTPDDIDFIGPMKLTPCSTQDWLVFYHQGAYCSVFKTGFCAMEKTYTRSIISSELWHALKDKSVFTSIDFITDSDMPASLPSTLPPVIPDNGKYALTVDSTLIE